MEPQTPIEFTPGTSVIYALHGKCNVIGTETRQLGNESILFYKLEVSRSSLSRSVRHDPAIWVPVATAKNRGLRNPMNQDQAEQALKALMSREYFFNTSESWSSLLPKLEACIYAEGGIGLAKVASFLHVFKKRQVVASSEVNKLQENVFKLLLRELSEALHTSARELEEKISKGFRSKLIPDN